MIHIFGSMKDVSLRCYFMNIELIEVLGTRECYLCNNTDVFIICEGIIAESWNNYCACNFLLRQVLTTWHCRSHLIQQITQSRYAYILNSAAYVSQKLNKWDAIKQNESELESNLVFNFSLSFVLRATICWKPQQNWDYGYESELEKNNNLDFNFSLSFVLRATICWKPQQNWAYGSRGTAILVLLKTMKYKGNWLLLFAVSKNQY